MTEDNGNLIICPVPSLVATLLSKERDKGSPLSEEEVLEIRDNAPSIALTAEDQQRLIERRGYEDIDPEDAWNEWVRARTELVDDEGTSEQAN